MSRILSALALGILVAGGASAADEKKLTIRWHGQSFFEIHTSAGTRIVLDPHGIDAFGRVTGVKADLIICSHRHNDHTRIDVVENSNKDECKKIYGVDGEQIGKQKWNEFKDMKFKDAIISMVGTYHDDAQGLKRGLNAVTIIEVDGLRIVHLGDLGHALSEGQLKRIGKVDILMVPVGGVYTLNGSEAKEVVAQLQPTRYIIPMHYGLPNYTVLLPVDEFLEDQKNVQKLKTNELVIDPSKKADKPAVVLMQWAEK